MRPEEGLLDEDPLIRAMARAAIEQRDRHRKAPVFGQRADDVEISGGAEEH